MGADVAVLDRNPEALRRVDAVLGNRVRSVFSTRGVGGASRADLVIATVLVPGSTTPKLITAQTGKAVKTGAVAARRDNERGCVECLSSNLVFYGLGFLLLCYFSVYSLDQTYTYVRRELVLLRVDLPPTNREGAAIGIEKDMVDVTVNRSIEHVLPIVATGKQGSGIGRREWELRCAAYYAMRTDPLLSYSTPIGVPEDMLDDEPLAAFAISSEEDVLLIK
jgi:hypothetical protein